jgi:hypothetical protein
MTNSDEYLEGFKRSGLKVGDRVYLIRRAEKEEGGWNYIWLTEMDSLIGKHYIITDIYTNGNIMIGRLRMFPYFVFEKVNPRIYLGDSLLPLLKE